MKIECDRYYYSKDELYEKSLDIYYDRDDATHNNKPIVVLVVGSGWTGHQPWIYRVCSWWNSSGPKTIARLGYTCICVRHRGTFPRLFVYNTSDDTKKKEDKATSPTTTTTSLGMMIQFFLGSIGLLHAFFSMSDGTNNDSSGYLSLFLLVASILGLLGIALHVFFAVSRQGCATMNDMLHDVLEAITWIHKQQQQQQSDNNGILPKSAPLIFGGYSSGGHVATTLLQRPQMFASKGLPAPDQLFSGVLILSGVLAVRPPIEAGQSPPPRWFTDFAMQIIWGQDEARHIPSPLEGVMIAAKANNSSSNNTEKIIIPSIPHVFVGCKKEMFGINWLDLFFCSQQYDAILQTIGIPSKFVQVNSDHWSILNSTALRNALECELETIMTPNDAKTTTDSRRFVTKSSSSMSMSNQSGSTTPENGSDTSATRSILSTSSSSLSLSSDDEEQDPQQQQYHYQMTPQQ